MKYTCNTCNMSVENLVCAKCKKELNLIEIEINGKTVKVAKCKQCEGMIKSPECCGHDMNLK